MKGFTLIELMVVTALVMILAIIVFPRFVGLVGGREAVSFASRLSGALDYTRAMAIFEGRPYFFYLDREHKNYWVTRMGAEGEEEPAPGRLGRRQEFPTGLRITGRLRSPIRFFPGGNSDEALIELRREGNYRRKFTIQVKPYAGRSKVTVKG